MNIPKFMKRAYPRANPVFFVQYTLENRLDILSLSKVEVNPFNGEITIPPWRMDIHHRIRVNLGDYLIWYPDGILSMVVTSPDGFRNNYIEA